MTINDKQFLELTQADAPVLVEFMAPWCVYCRKISKPMEQLEEAYAGRMPIVLLNIDDYEALSDKEGIELVPTLRIYKAGKVLGQIVAPDSKAAIEQFIQQNIS